MQLIRVNFNRYSTAYLEIMSTNQLYILLADDDEDDCLFFQEALNELSMAIRLTAVHDGEQLMTLLHENKAQCPDVLFLDLNMPRKNGYECLLEIRSNEQLRQLPVVILSTFFDRTVSDQLYQSGATWCMMKPAAHSELKTLLQQALRVVAQKAGLPPASETVGIG